LRRRGFGTGAPKPHAPKPRRRGLPTPNARSNRALALLKLNKLGKALADAQQCTRLDPSNAKGWFRQAQVLEEQGHIEQVRPRGGTAGPQGLAGRGAARGRAPKLARPRRPRPFLQLAP
jgi:tetratricopeptide (TPR) repeat protein